MALAAPVAIPVLMLPVLPAWLAVVLVAIAPAIRWWQGRALAAAVDDPLLSERLLAHTRRTGAVAGTCVALLVFGWPSTARWTVPLLIVLHTAAGFPLRKLLYQETWHLQTFLWFFARLFTAMFGFWLLLAATPWLAAMAGRYDWIASVALAAALYVWQSHTPFVVRRLLGARPVADAKLCERFDALVAKAGVRRPRFEYVSLNGGVVANALAQPSRGESLVLVTETLLARLTTDEIAAIAAHEIAHLEEFERAPRRRVNAAIFALLAITAAVAPASRAAFGPSSTALYLWPCLLGIAIAIVAQRRQKNETTSDVRAVELTGDAEALARALTKLYAIARIPRRWDQQLEERATHPSLARRIRDIRASAGAPPSQIEVPMTFYDAAGSGTATFDAAGVSWQQTAGIVQVTAYSALVELRLRPAAGGRASLVGADGSGQTWHMTPRTEDLDALQRLLDRVDGCLAPAPARPFSPFVTRLVAAVACGLAAVIGQIAFALVALLAALAPAPALLNAGGAAGIGAALWLLVNSSASDLRWPGATLCLCIAASLLALAWVRRRERARGQDALALALAALCVLAVCWIAITGFNPMRVHQMVRSVPAVAVLLAATAAAAWSGRERRPLGYVAGVAALAAAAALAAGTHSFVALFGHDLFLVSAPAAKRTMLKTTLAGQFEIPFDVSLVRISPTGKLAAVLRDEDSDSHTDGESRVFHVAGAGSRLVDVHAHDLLFVDDAHALVLVTADACLEVRTLDVASGAVQWRQPLTRLKSGALAYRRATSTWFVNGRDSVNGLAQAAGTIGRSEVRWTTAPVPKAGGWIESWAADAGAAIAIEKEVDAGFAARRWPLWSAALRPPIMSRSQLWWLHGDTRQPLAASVLDTRCVGDLAGEGRLVCAAYDGTRTRLVSLDVAAPTPRPLATIEGRFYPDESGAPGWLSGWSGSTPVVVHLATADVVDAPRDSRGGDPFSVAVSDAAVATVSTGADSSHIRIYPLR